MIDGTIANLASVFYPFLDCLAKMNPDQDARQPFSSAACVKLENDGALLGPTALLLGAQEGQAARLKLTWSVSNTRCSTWATAPPSTPWPES